MSKTDNEVQAGAPGKAKKEVVDSTVTMDDGRIVEFAGKRKMLKTEAEFDGQAAVRFDFLNGETRIFAIPEKMTLRLAQHGAAQKFGDETAGIEDVEDMILAVDKLAERLNAGEWNVKRQSEGIAGTSVLARALAQHSGKPMEAVRAFLANKTHAEKVALRSNPAIAVIIAKLEEGKKSKAAKSVDTEALLGELA